MLFAPICKSSHAVDAVKKSADGVAAVPPGIKYTVFLRNWGGRVPPRPLTFGNLGYMREKLFDKHQGRVKIAFPDERVWL